MVDFHRAFISSLSSLRSSAYPDNASRKYSRRRPATMHSRTTHIERTSTRTRRPPAAVPHGFCIIQAEALQEMVAIWSRWARTRGTLQSRRSNYATNHPGLVSVLCCCYAVNVPRISLRISRQSTFKCWDKVCCSPVVFYGRYCECGTK